jgi:hypothetical protein
MPGVETCCPKWISTRIFSHSRKSRKWMIVQESSRNPAVPRCFFSPGAAWGFAQGPGARNQPAAGWSRPLKDGP